MRNRAVRNEGLSPLQRGVILAIPLSFLLTPLIPLEIVGVIAIGFGWWLVPKFWSTVFAGAVGGVVAGVILLGWGFRLAMRVVAILDPFRTPEFSIDGTLFILIGIGGIFGGIIGVNANLAKRGLGLRSVFLVAILPAVGAMMLILVAEETRSELFELGAGAWFNIPMFSLVSYAYGVGAAFITEKLDARLSRKRAVNALAELPT